MVLYTAVAKSFTISHPVPDNICRSLLCSQELNTTTGIPFLIAYPTSNIVPASNPSAIASITSERSNPAISGSTVSGPPIPTLCRGENILVFSCKRAL